MEHLEIGHAVDLLREADALVISASNGFDIADGYNQFACDKEFLRVFGDLHRRYGLTSILQGLMARWPGTGARWEFLSALIRYGYRDYEPSSAMRAVLKLATAKPSFVVTCNCNGRFVRAGIPVDSILETEGSFARLRCSAGCHAETYDSLAYVDDPEPPRCPRCASPLDAAVDDGGRLGECEPYRSQAKRFKAFLSNHGSGRVLVLELGVGQRNQAIKRPLMAWAESSPGAGYVVVNREEPVLPALPDERAVGLRGDLREVLLLLGSAGEAA